MFFHLALLVAACVFSFTTVVNTMAISVEKQAAAFEVKERMREGERERERKKGIKRGGRGYRGDGKAKAHGRGSRQGAAVVTVHSRGHTE